MKSKLLKNEVTPGLTKVKLDGKEYILTLPMSAVIRYKQVAGDNLFNLKSWAKIDEDPQKLVQLFWCALQEHQPETKIEDVEKLCSVANAMIASAALAGLIVSSMPKPKEVAKGEAAPDPNV